MANLSRERADKYDVDLDFTVPDVGAVSDAISTIAEQDALDLDSAYYGTADLENEVPATTQTEFSIASIPKPLTAAAILQLAARGKIRLDDDISLFRTAGEIFANALERKRTETENEALQVRLRRRQRLEAIGTLAGGIAHNFNNILGAILGYSEMALGRLSADSRPSHYVREVRRTVAHLAPRPVVLVGHSMGGLVVQRVIAEHDANTWLLLGRVDRAAEHGDEWGGDSVPHLGEECLHIAVGPGAGDRDRQQMSAGQRGLGLAAHLLPRLR